MPRPLSESPQTAFKKALKRLALISAILAAVTVLILLAAVQFPSVQRGILNIVFDRSADSLGFRIRARSVHINWFSGSLHADEVWMLPVPMDSPARFTIDSLRADISIIQLLQGNIAVEQFSVVNPVLTAEQLPDGTIKWPWVIKPAPERPADPVNPGKGNFLSKFSIANATVDSGSIILLQRGEPNPSINVTGINLTAALNAGLRDINANMVIPTASWRNPAARETVALTQPLVISIASADHETVAVSLKTEIDEFALTVDGTASVVSDPHIYAFHVTGNGPVNRILANLGIEDVAAPDLTLSASITPDGGKAELLIHTGDGKVALRATAGGPPTWSPWEIDLDFERFPLDVATPWLPENVDLQGNLNGSVLASGLTRDWRLAEVAGSLTIQRHPSPDLLRTFRLRPSGVIDFSFHDQVATINRLELNDQSLHARLSGTYTMQTGDWSAAGDVQASDLSPWLATVGIDGGGKAELSGQFKGAAKLDDVTGNGRILITDGLYSGHRMDRVHLSIDVARSRFSTEIHHFALDDLVLSAKGSGDLVMPPGGSQAIDLTVNSLKWRDLPEQMLSINWKRTATNQSAELRTSDGMIEARFTGDATGRWTGIIDLTDFQMEPVAVFLPETLDDMTGAISARIEVKTSTSQANPDVHAALSNLNFKLYDRVMQMKEPAVITMRNNTLSADGLTITADDGSRISLNGSWSLDSGKDAGALQGVISVPELAAWKIPGMPDGMTGAVEATLNLRNTGTIPEPEGTVTATNLQFGDMGITQLSAQFLKPVSPGGMSMNLTIDNFTTGAGDSGPRLSGNGRIDLKTDVDNPENQSIILSLDSLTADLKNLHYINEMPILVRLENQTVFLDSFSISGPETSLSADGFLPLKDTSGDAGRIDLRIDAGVKPLGVFFPGSGEMRGILSAAIQIAGSVENPQITGSVELKDIKVDHPDLPGPVENLNGMMVITPEMLELQGVTAVFGGGRVDIGGSVVRNGMSFDNVDLTMRARNLDVNYSPDMQIRGGADIGITGKWPDIAIGGSVRITDALYTPEFDIMELLASLTRPSVVIADGPDDHDRSLGIPLDITILAPENVRIENSNLNVLLNARLQISGTTAIPGILGSVTLDSGSIDLLLHEFEVTSGTISFTQPFDIDPNLDIVAVTQTQGEVITFRISGRASRPNLLLSSESGKSHSEIMSLLLGRNVTAGEGDLSTMATDYAKQALAMAAAEAITSRTNLIIVPFPVTLEDEKLIIGVGRRFGKSWKVMYYVGERSTDGDVIEVEFDINSKTDLRLRQNQDGTFSGGFRYRETFN